MVIQFNRDPERIDKYLSTELEDYTRSYIQKLIRSGAVQMDGETVRASYILSGGEEITLELPELKEPEILPKSIPLDILYEDQDLLVVNKPKGMVVHPAPGHYDDTLVNGLMAYCRDDLSGIGGVARPGIVHRIDKNTSGTLLVCKNDQTHQAISAQLKEHNIKRIYKGVVCGCPKEQTGTIRGYLGRHPKDRKKRSVVSPDRGKTAVTHYQVLQKFKGYSLLEFKLETGRTHQIRVHMASIHHPLLADDLYGSGKNPFSIEGQVLHAETIGFIHPGTGQYMEFSAPLPEYFEDLLSKLNALS